jgi:hypothetical protein
MRGFTEYENAGGFPRAVRWESESRDSHWDNIRTEWITAYDLDPVSWFSTRKKAVASEKRCPAVKRKQAEQFEQAEA